MQYDGDMQARVEQATASDRVLRYVGEVDVKAKKCRAALQVCSGSISAWYDAALKGSAARQ